jgi:hypothetical protein
MTPLHPTFIICKMGIFYVYLAGYSKNWCENMYKVGSDNLKVFTKFSFSFLILKFYFLLIFYVWKMLPVLSHKSLLRHHFDKITFLGNAQKYNLWFLFSFVTFVPSSQADSSNLISLIASHLKYVGVKVAAVIFILTDVSKNIDY